MEQANHDLVTVIQVRAKIKCIFVVTEGKNVYFILYLVIGKNVMF
jgi:hypothetical protein